MILKFKHDGDDVSVYADFDDEEETFIGVLGFNATEWTRFVASTACEDECVVIEVLVKDGDDESLVVSCP